MHKVISLVIVFLLLQNVLGSEGGINENMSLEDATEKVKVAIKEVLDNKE